MLNFTWKLHIPVQFPQQWVEMTIEADGMTRTSRLMQVLSQLFAHEHLLLFPSPLSRGCIPRLGVVGLDGYSSCNHHNTQYLQIIQLSSRSSLQEEFKPITQGTGYMQVIQPIVWSGTLADAFCPARQRCLDRFLSFQSENKAFFIDCHSSTGKTITAAQYSVLTLSVVLSTSG